MGDPLDTACRFRDVSHLKADHAYWGSHEMKPTVKNSAEDLIGGLGFAFSIAAIKMGNPSFGNTWLMVGATLVCVSWFLKCAARFDGGSFGYVGEPTYQVISGKALIGCLVLVPFIALFGFATVVGQAPHWHL